MGVITFKEVKVWQVALIEQGYAVLLKPLEDDAAIPIFIGQTEAQSTLISLSGVSLPTPNAYDLFVSGILKTGNTIKKIEISEIADGILNSIIYVDGETGIIELEANPSDSVVIAARTGCKLYISDEIFKDSGISLAMFAENIIDIPKEYKSLKSRLQQSLFGAIREENYEEAMALRDEINKINQRLTAFNNL